MSLLTSITHSIKRIVNHFKTTKRLKPMYAHIQSALEAIRNLPSCELNKRQPMLVDLLVSLVNFETQDGSLTGDRQLEANDWWATLGALLNDAGFKRLGNGHFAAAYAHALLPGKVIKVGFKKEDSGAAYAAFCRMHQGLAGIPVIHDIQRHASCYTVVMDKLQSAEYSSQCSSEFNMLYDEVRYAVESPHNADSSLDGVRDLLGENAAATVQTARMIHKFFKGIASFDMHRGNIMMDDKGRLVITDPVSFSHDREKAKKDGFAVDPEELLKEIEVMAWVQVIARCRARKAKCNPAGTFWMDIKAKRKRKQARRVQQAKQQRELPVRRAKEKLENHNFVAGLRAAAMRHGSVHVHNIWQHNKMAQIVQIAEQEAAQMRAMMQWQIANGMVLLHDDQLQARLMG